MRSPVRLPVAVGLKATPSWQVPPAGTDAQPLEVMRKSPVVMAATLERVKTELLVSVKFFGAVVKPTISDPKSAAVGS